MELADLFPCAEVSALEEAPKESRQVCALTTAGNGATPNQDACASFTCKGVQVLVLADGVGGSDFGDTAAQVAVRSAAQSIVRALNKGIGLIDVLAQAFADASACVREASKEIGRDIRTTLLLVLGGKQVFVCGYLGDGMLLHVRASRATALLKPMRDTQWPHLLTGSLGHVQEGEPIISVTSRMRDDMLIASTDGIADLAVGSEFAQDIRTALQIQANPNEAIASILESLSTAEDIEGRVAGDNLTLGIMTVNT